MDVKELREELKEWNGFDDTEITIAGLPISRIGFAETGCNLEIQPDTPSGVREITCNGMTYDCLSADDIWQLEEEIQNLEEERSDYESTVESLEFEVESLRDALERSKKWTEKYLEYLTNLFKGPELMDMKEILGPDSELKQVEQDLKAIERAFDYSGGY